MAAFSSTERIKRRYLLVKGKREAIEKAILDYIGMLGWARAAPVFLPAQGETCIVAVERKELIHVRAALAVASEELKVVRVSGTIKGLGIRKP